MLTLEHARERLADSTGPLEPVRVPLVTALGTRLAEDVRADLPLPPADTAAMDGYAVRAADLARGGPLPVSSEIAAGATGGALSAGHAARIFTGGALPDGADTVVAQEQAIVLEGGQVLLEGRHPRGENVRRSGELYEAQSIVATRGTLVTPQCAALLASAGVSHPRVVPRPRVAILVTGDELVRHDATPGAGQIRDTNGVLLRGLALEAGLAVVNALDPERVRDDREVLRAAVERALAAADVVITSGGVSVGDYDFIPRAIADLGGEVLFHKVAIKPGKPVLLARLRGRWIVALPGNPLACLLVWRLFVRPLCESLAGDSAAFDEVPWPAISIGEVRNDGSRPEFRPARLRRNGGAWECEVIPWRGSHDLLAGAAAAGFVRIDPGVEVAAGSKVEVYRLPW